LSKSKRGTATLAAGEVSWLADGPSDAETIVVLAHGAGSPMDSPYMEAFAEGLAAAEVRVVRFNFLYSQAGKRAPDRGPVLEQTFEGILEYVRAEWSPPRLVAGGKSLGGRIASQIAARGVECDGLVFLGYPLHPPGRPDRMRDEHLYDLAVPMLFVEGTRDPFCPLPTLEKVVAGLRGPARIAVIEDGDHSLKVPKSSGRSTEGAWAEGVAAVVAWLGTIRDPS
jgi:predicted alpha/beta-hydrolase family hydrolase